jgi:hypothetical protein
VSSQLTVSALKRRDTSDTRSSGAQFNYDMVNVSRPHQITAIMTRRAVNLEYPGRKILSMSNPISSFLRSLHRVRLRSIRPTSAGDRNWDSRLRAVGSDAATVNLGARSIIIGLEDHGTDDSDDHLPVSAASNLEASLRRQTASLFASQIPTLSVLKNDKEEGHSPLQPGVRCQ